VITTYATLYNDYKVKFEDEIKKEKLISEQNKKKYRERAARGKRAKQTRQNRQLQSANNNSSDGEAGDDAPIVDAKGKVVSRAELLKRSQSLGKILDRRRKLEEEEEEEGEEGEEEEREEEEDEEEDSDAEWRG
jgi:hypothetical protein